MDNNKVSDYIILKNICIGQGAFSKVYLGHSKDDIRERVAVKEININRVSDALREKFYEEMNIMNIIKRNPHKNIVKCMCITHRADKIFIVMEYCESGELSKLIKKNLSEEKVKFYFKQIVEAIIHLDNLKIVHRDIKPANILLTDNNTTVKITDFGLSRVVNNSHMMNTIVGTPFYMSPEILNEKEYNKNTDIWSLGIILYELVYGTHPFKYCSNLEDLKDTLNQTDIIYLPYNKKRVALSNECIELMKALLNKDLKNRIKLHDILNHHWFRKRDIVHHEFVVVEDHFQTLQSQLPIINEKNRNGSFRHDHVIGSAPDPWHVKLVDSLWNIGSSTFGYISRFGFYDSQQKLLPLPNSSKTIMDSFDEKIPTHSVTKPLLTSTDEIIEIDDIKN